MSNSYDYEVYKHTAPNGKSYIGISKRYDQRCKEHRSKNSACTAFAFAINEYGWDNFTHEILHTNLNKGEAEELECVEIAAKNSLYPNGYNRVIGNTAARNKEFDWITIALNKAIREKEAYRENWYSNLVW